MSKGLNRLTVVEIKAAKPGTALNDGGGLLYRATAQGVGKFAFKFTSPDLDYRAAQAAKGSKSIQREMGLGAYPTKTSLPAARLKAAAARDLIAKKLDPIEEERRAEEETQHRAAQLTQAATVKAMTFGRYADEHFLPFAIPGFTNNAHIQQWKATFKTHAKRMRNKPLAEITREDVLGVLKPIWTDKVVTASRSRERIERLFSHAIQNGHYKGDNPASWQQFNATLPTPRKAPRHHASIPLSQIAEFVSTIRAKQSDSMAALMIEWIILAAYRDVWVRGYVDQVVIGCGGDVIAGARLCGNHANPKVATFCSALWLTFALPLTPRGDHVQPDATGAPQAVMNSETDYEDARNDNEGCQNDLRPLG